VTNWKTTDRFDERTRLAAEFALLYATDHHAIDDAFWDRMFEHYTQAETVELSMLHRVLDGASVGSTGSTVSMLPACCPRTNGWTYGR